MSELVAIWRISLSASPRVMIFRLCSVKVMWRSINTAMASSLFFNYRSLISMIVVVVWLGLVAAWFSPALKWWDRSVRFPSSSLCRCSSIVSSLPMSLDSTASWTTSTSTSDGRAERRTYDQSQPPLPAMYEPSVPLKYRLSTTLGFSFYWCPSLRICRFLGANVKISWNYIAILKVGTVASAYIEFRNRRILTVNKG